MIILEACSSIERVNMVIPHDLSYFLFYLPIVKDTRVILPFSNFEAQVIRVINIARSQSASNSWGFVRAFEIVC